MYESDLVDFGVSWPHLIYKRANLEKGHHPIGGSSMGRATLPEGPLGSPGPIYQTYKRANLEKGHHPPSVPNSTYF